MNSQYISDAETMSDDPGCCNDKFELSLSHKHTICLYLYKGDNFCDT